MGHLLCEKVWPYLDSWDSVRLRTASTHWNVPGKYGPHGELFFEACALIGLYLLVADYEVGSNDSQSLDQGDMWTYGCPKSPICSSLCPASVTSGDDEEYGHNNECRAIEVIEQDWSSDVVPLFL